MVLRATIALATSAIVSTDAIASEATTQVDPHNSANWMIDLVSSSMNPAPRRKNCHDQRRAVRRRAERAERREHRDDRHDQHDAERDDVVLRDVAILQIQERPVVGRRFDRRIALVGCAPGSARATD